MYKVYQRFSEYKGFYTIKVNDMTYVGSCPRSQQDMNQLSKLGILSVISLQCEDERDTAYDYPQHWTVLRIPTHDYSVSSCRDLKVASKFLRLQTQKNRKTYIHCRNGKGRSRSCAYFYLRECGKCDESSIQMSKCFNNSQLRKTRSMFNHSQK